MAAQLFLCLSASPTTVPPLLVSSRNRTSSSLFLATPKPSSSCRASTQDSQLTENNNRRSANYQPNLWNFEILHSRENELEVERVKERARKLEEEVRGEIRRRAEEEDGDGVRLLEFIDNVQRLGVGYKFETEIKAALQNHYKRNKNAVEASCLGLHATALSFRLLRQHGFQVSEVGVVESLKEAEIRGDVQGLLSVYEASFLGFEGEHELEEARAFAHAHLLNHLDNNLLLDPRVGEKVQHALELPYHRRLHRLEARWFIERYEGEEEEALLELAKLDFNTVQSEMKRELQQLSRWWRQIGLTAKLDFVRDRLMEVYFWALGMAPDPSPSHRRAREAVTKMFGLVTIIDDVYDVYGTVEELQLFTDAVERWDAKSGMETLPDYMKLCFLALYNTVNDTAYATLREEGRNTLPCLAGSWSDLCKAFLQEAKWSNNSIIPAFRDYLRNASVSSSGGALLAPCLFLFQGQDSNTNTLLHSDLVRSSCAIFRLCNDLATSAAELERGETTNSITSYMNQNGCSEEEARESLRKLIDLHWNKMNRLHMAAAAAADADGEQALPIPKAFRDIAINMARVSHCTYQYGDGLGRPDDTAENRIKLLLLHPIPIN